MAQYSDPRQFANIFSIYSQVYKTEEEQKEAEKEKKKEYVGYAAKPVQMAEANRATQIAEARLLQMTPDPDSRTGFKYEPDDTPREKGLRGWLKHRYRKPEDRVRLSERTPEAIERARVAENKMFEEKQLNMVKSDPDFRYGPAPTEEALERNLRRKAMDQRAIRLSKERESFPKPDTLDNITPEPVATTPGLLDESVYSEYLGRKDESGRFLNKDIQAIYDETYEEGLRKRGFDLDLTPIEETAKEVTSTISQAPKYDSFGDLVKARDTAEKGSVLYQDVQSQINKLYEQGGGTYEGAKEAFGTVDTALDIKETAESAENILGAVDVGEGLETTTKATASLASAAPGLGTVAKAYQAGSILFDKDADPDEQARALGEMGLNYATGGLYGLGKGLYGLLGGDLA
tara:strand:+ start:1316 stop:2527 length:1212 start_codon:yes stop_codon:yes gene_type:complete